MDPAKDSKLEPNKAPLKPTVESLEMQLVQVRTNAVNRLNDDKLRAREEVKQLLQNDHNDQNNQYGMDDCFRWHLLFECANIKHVDGVDTEARVDICLIIIENWPYLAFENPYDQSSQKRNCVDPKIHRQIKHKAVPFYEAVRYGSVEVVKSMISHGKELYKHKPAIENTLVQILEKGEKVSNKSKSILDLATNADHGSSETLMELLSLHGTVNFLEQDLDRTFNYALEDGLHEIVQKFLEYEELAARYAASEFIIRAMGHIKEQVNPAEPNSTDDDATRRKIAETLISRAKGQDAFDNSVAEVIIKRGFMAMWNAKPENAPDKDIESYLLHLAVLYQQEEFVDLFVNQYPGSVSEERALPIQNLATNSKGERFPLWYNNHSLNSSGTDFVLCERGPIGSARARIRDKVVNKMIHEVGDMKMLSAIFHKSDVGELNLDLSRYNSATFPISTFVDSLVSHGKLSYEQTLRYVEFPPLDMTVANRETVKENAHLEHEHIEVFKVLNWLMKRGVRSIISLKVPDRLVNPHNDLRIAKVVERFGVETLDWKVLNLSISIFKPKVKCIIKELHLYSSGNRAVVNHWFSDEGIKSLKKAS
ncbi:hypothetical protein Hte_007269 [Hypoxylon texense]